MSRNVILFGLWCLIVLAGVVVAGAAAWDPFADGNGHHAGPGEHTAHHHGGYGGGYWGGFGPSHK